MKGFKFEPQSTAEVVRVGIAMLIIFNVLPWTPQQEVAVLLFASVFMTWITRSFSIPVQTIVDAGTTVKKLESAAETRAAIAAGEKPPLAPGALVALLVAGSMFLTGCGGNNKPNLSPVGRVADNASEVIRAADLALTAVDALTPSVLKPDTTKRIARVFQEVGKGGLVLADALATYKKNVSPESWRSLQAALTSVNGLVADALALAPEGPARDRVKQIVQPIFDALFAITLPPPPTPATLHDLNDWHRWQLERHVYLNSEIATAQ